MLVIYGAFRHAIEYLAGAAWAFTFAGGIGAL